MTIIAPKLMSFQVSVLIIKIPKWIFRLFSIILSNNTVVFSNVGRELFSYLTNVYWLGDLKRSRAGERFQLVPLFYSLWPTFFFFLMVKVFFIFKIYFIYLSLAALGLCCCTRAFL